MLELDESRQVEKVLKRMKQFLLIPIIENNNDNIPYNSTYLAADLLLIEDYLHQIDNAVNFIHLNGLEVLMTILTEYGTFTGEYDVNTFTEKIEIVENTLALIGVLANNNEDVTSYINTMPLNGQFPSVVKINNDNNDQTRQIPIKNPILAVLDLMNSEIISNLKVTSRMEGKYYLSKLIYALSAMVCYLIRFFIHFYQYL